MFQKKDYVAVAIACYIFFIMLFFLVQERHSVDPPCNSEHPCVRFCCKDINLCKENYIRENFNESLDTEWMSSESEIDKEKFIILHGKPKCSLMSISEKHNWTFYYVRLVQKKSAKLKKIVFRVEMF